MIEVNADDPRLRAEMDKIYREKVLKPVTQAVRKVALQLFTSIIQGSPVDKGTFRFNWQVGLGTRPGGTLTISAPQGSSGAPPSDVELQRLREVLTALKDTELTTIYIVNNLPYAERIENEGWSKQAPNGVIAVAVAELRALGKEILLSQNGVQLGGEP